MCVTASLSGWLIPDFEPIAMIPKSDSGGLAPADMPSGLVADVRATADERWALLLRRGPMGPRPVAHSDWRNLRWPAICIVLP